MDFFPIRLRFPFPKLTDANHRKTSPESPHYNCFGWAILGREVLMGPKDGWFWPADVPLDLRLSTFHLLLDALDFQRCESGDPELDFDRVLLYGSGENVTHAARQLESGKLTSKRGIFGDDIEHDTADAITGGEYFEILAYFRRRKLTESN